jgi:hypothetical protein
LPENEIVWKNVFTAWINVFVCTSSAFNNVEERFIYFKPWYYYTKNMQHPHICIAAINKGIDNIYFVLEWNLLNIKVYASVEIYTHKFHMIELHEREWKNVVMWFEGWKQQS